MIQPWAQSIELMLKSEGFNDYTTDLDGEGVDLGKRYDDNIHEVTKTLRIRSK